MCTQILYGVFACHIIVENGAVRDDHIDPLHYQYNVVHSIIELFKTKSIFWMS